MVAIIFNKTLYTLVIRKIIFGQISSLMIVHHNSG